VAEHGGADNWQAGSSAWFSGTIRHWKHLLNRKLLFFVIAKAGKMQEEQRGMILMKLQECHAFFHRPIIGY